MNIFVSRQSQCTRWRRKSKGGKTKRCPWNLISSSPRRNLSRNLRKMLRSTSFLWLVFGGDHSFEGPRRPVASCYCICPVWIYGRNIIVTTVHSLLLFLSGYELWHRPEWWYNICCPAMCVLYFQILLGCGLQVICIGSWNPFQRMSWQWTNWFVWLVLRWQSDAWFSNANLNHRITWSMCHRLWLDWYALLTQQH